jgi:hypothetical protein
MGKTTRAGGGNVAGTGTEAADGLLVRGKRMVIRDGSIQFSGTDGATPDTEITRAGAGSLTLPGGAFSGAVSVAGAATMASTLDVTGTLTAFGYLGVGGNAGVTGGLDVSGSCSGIWGPRDNTLVAATGDPENASGLTLLTGGTIYLAKMGIARTATPTKLYWYVTTGATTATASQCWVGVLSSAGTLLGSSVDVATTSQSSGLKTTTVAPGSLTAGTFVWGAIVCAASVLPTLAGAPDASLTTLSNVGCATAALRYATNGTSQTTLTTRTPSSNVAGPAIWMGLGA